MSEFDAARRHMIDSQIRPNRVTDGALLAAFGHVPRERFVPEKYRGVAYVDEDLDLGGGRSLMEPMVLARLLQAAAPKVDDVALVVGAATGYSVAILADICSTVVGVESDAALLEAANANLADLHVDNALVMEGGLEDGFAAQSPYDVILIDGAVEEIPEPILEQLGVGGRLVTIIDDSRHRIGRGTIAVRYRSGTGRRVLFDAAVPQLPGFQKRVAFTF